jgi:hypothetical protein
MLLTYLLEGYLLSCDHRITNTRIPPEILGILILEKPRLLRLTLMEKLKVCRDGKKG